MNWKTETMEKLRRYPLMVKAVQIIPMELRRLEQEAAALAGTSVGQGTGAGDRGREDKLLNILVRKRTLELNRRNAQWWVDFTRQALEQLAPEDRQLLTHLYMETDRSIQQICYDLGMEKTSLYRRRESALKNLTLIMFGATES